MNRRLGVVILLVGMVFAATVPAWAQIGKGRPKAKLRLLSSVDTVEPGHPFDVVIQFNLDPGWHIYWHNSGESGLPPQPTWKLPNGFTVGELRYPVPKSHLDPGDIVTNILEHDPALLITITPPGAIDATSVTVATEVQYLICKDTCLRESAKLSIELPVRSDGSAAKPANEEFFADARSALPKARSKYVTVSASTSKPPTPGETFDLNVNVEVIRGYHIQSHKPLIKGLFACGVFVKRIDDVYFDPAVYPKPKVRNDKTLGKLSEYTGKITIKVTTEVDSESKGPYPFGGVFVFQACDDHGHCFPPEAVEFSLGEKTSQRTESGIAPATGSAVAQTGEDHADADEVIASTTPASVDDADAEGFFERFGIAGLLAACFLYGLFINATPCVLPLLSIKVLGFVQQAHESRSRTMMLGLSFGAGVIVFFAMLGFLARSGGNIFQYPAAVIAVGAIVMALALSMLGVYTINVPTVATSLEAGIQQEGMFASFGKGALAPVLGLACTGPFLAGAFGWATQQPQHIALIAFLFVGLGMASPYMLLGANPNWLSFLPKPGNWMITFERIMGFLLMAMVIWLLHPLITHIGAEGLEWTLGFLVAVAMSCWVLGKIEITMPAATRWKYRAWAGGIVAVSGVLIYGWIYPIADARERIAADRLAALAGASNDGSDWSRGIPWRPWSAEAVAETVRSGKVAFVDFTAAYCTVCKANKKVATTTADVIAKMQDCGAVPFQGDFTSGDKEIFALLQQHDRAGVPLNLIYPANHPDKPILLRPQLTKQYLLDRLDQACAGSSIVRAGS